MSKSRRGSFVAGSSQLTQAVHLWTPATCIALEGRMCDISNYIPGLDEATSVPDVTLQ